MLTKRIIPCLDVKGGRVVKGVHFRDHRDAGDPVELAAFCIHRLRPRRAPSRSATGARWGRWGIRGRGRQEALRAGHRASFDASSYVGLVVLLLLDTATEYSSIVLRCFIIPKLSQRSP